MEYKTKCDGKIDKDCIFSILLNEAKRKELSKTSKFKKTNEYWNKGKFNYIQNIGALSVIAQNANQSWADKGNNGRMPKKYLVDWYLYTGDLRLEFVSKGDKSIFKKSEYGRTMPELYTLANNFKNYTKHQGDIDLDMQEAFNYVMIRIFDKTYEGFLREENTLDNINMYIKNKHNFIAANSYQDVFYSVDYIGYDSNNKITCALQIKPITYHYSKNGSIYRRTNVKKHNKFYRDYGVYPIVVYSDINGYIINNTEVLKKLTK